MATDAASAARANARMAYELGRLRLGACAALPVLPMVALSLLLGRHPGLSLGAGALLVLLAVGLRARGQAYGRALLPGLMAGSVPLILPLLLRAAGHCCIGGACWPLCMVGCITGGLLAGIAVGLSALGERDERGTFLLVATLVAGLTGVLGCAMAGASGIAGMAIATVAAPWPVVFAVRARAQS